MNVRGLRPGLWLVVRRQPQSAGCRNWSRIALSPDWSFRSFDKTLRASCSACEGI
jgi:hypothetical protein